MPAKLALAVFGVLLGNGAADAQIFIASNGQDSNNCGRAAPCRSLQRGVNATGAGRVLTILDAGDYGKATITRSITISAEKGATIRAPSGAGATAITINAPGGNVVLRGLMLAGGGVAAWGVRIDAAASVHIENCEIERFGIDGIMVNGASTELFVSNTVSRDNGSHGISVAFTDQQPVKFAVDNSVLVNNDGNGLLVFSATNVEGAITRTVASGNGFNGISADGGGRVNIRWTTAANNGNDGFYLYADTADMTLDSVISRGNGTGAPGYAHAGLEVAGGATARISNSVIEGNAVGILNDGTVYTRGDNLVSGNGVKIGGSNPTLTPLSGT